MTTVTLPTKPRRVPVARTTIPWATAVWNPVTGCSHVSPGCEHCYAEAISLRFKRTPAPWTASHAAENVQVHEDRLSDPVHWTKPEKIFVNSVSDLFHEQVSDHFLLEVLLTMAICQQHTFLLLTKRPERMAQWLDEVQNLPQGLRLFAPDLWPLPNVILGVSVEDQRRADERLPILCKLAGQGWRTMVSVEPLLEPVDLSLHLFPSRFDEPRYDVPGWIIVGAESGPGARFADELDLRTSDDWIESANFTVASVRSVMRQAQAAGVPVFVKQLGSAWARTVGAKEYKGEDPAEWPEDLRVRQFPWPE